MNIVQIYKEFPTTDDCIIHLISTRWGGAPICPYCTSNNYCEEKNFRFKCLTCNTSYSVTVGTIFQNTKLDFQKWFVAISLVLNAKKGIAARQLARDIDVTKNTAWSMLMRIRKAMQDDNEMMEGIIEVDETYVGGKNKNRHAHKKTKGGQGRSTKDKVAVIGILQRGGKIVAKKAKDVTGLTLKTYINENVKKGSAIMSDEFGSYKGLNKKFSHEIVRHGAGQYVDGIVHTNTIEGFWSLLKRGVMGQFHQVTPKHINSYITEFCFRYNNRNNDQMFELVLNNALRVEA